MDDTRQYSDMSSAVSEDRFRQVFYTHLQADGYSDAEAYQFIFRTPDPFQSAPSDEHGLELLEASTKRYRAQLAHGWFLEGLSHKLEPDASVLQAPAKLVTFIVIPGIFGEFNATLPFQSVVDNTQSHFYKKWQTALEQVTDKVYSLFELSEVPCQLSDVVKIGSMDQGERSFANVITLRAPGGSLETLGSLESNVEVMRRRLAKVFEVIDDNTDLYLVGYSRGLAVALELVSNLHEQRKSGQISPANATWFRRVKGVVGIGGVYYGAKFARDVFSGERVAASDLIRLFSETSDKLKTIPDDVKRSKQAAILAENVATWARFVKRISKPDRPEIAAHLNFLGIPLLDAYEEEIKTRAKRLKLPVASPWGIFSVVNSFFLQTFDLRSFASRYNENILAFKQLVEAVITGVRTLTPASRDEWWRSHELPNDIVLLSITGTMPDANLHGFRSPLLEFEGFGPKTPDYNDVLRSSYYGTVASENTQINDSQLSHFSSRYWEQMYPEHRYAHYYLGVLGTHHWGMAFPFNRKDAESGGNTFPRATLLKSIASFIASLVPAQAGARELGVE